MATLAETTEKIRQELGARVTARGATPAPKTLLLGPDELAHTWEGRPQGSICIGLRLPSVEDKDAIIKEAIERVIKDHDLPTDEDEQARFERYRVQLYVARSICNPDDVQQPHQLFKAPDLQVPRCFTERALNRIFDECEALAISSSPISPEITDDEIEMLCTVMNSESLGSLEPHREARARRLLWFVLDELKRG